MFPARSRAGSRVGIRFEAEWSTAEGVWYRTMGNELLELDDSGLMCAARPACLRRSAELSWRLLAGRDDD